MAEITETEAHQMRAGSSDPYLSDLLPALRCLDGLLHRALVAAPEAFGTTAATSPYRGLYIAKDEAEKSLERAPGAPPFNINTDEDGRLSQLFSARGTRLGWLKDAFHLSDFDLCLILIALAPELDLRYETLYAYLQDNVTRRRPTVDLALNLLCATAETKLVRRAHFSIEAPLLRHKILYLLPDTNQLEPPLLAHYLKLDEQIIHLLLGHEVLDRRLATFCELAEPICTLTEIELDDEMRHGLTGLLSQTEQTEQAGQLLRLYLQGPESIDKRRLAEALMGQLGKAMLLFDIERALAADEKFEHLLTLVFREAWFKDAGLYLCGLDMLRTESWARQYQSLMRALGEHEGLVIMAGEATWSYSGLGPSGVFSLNLTLPEFSVRRAIWQTSLAAEDVRPTEHELDALADRFRLTPSQIKEAVRTARLSAMLRSLAQAPASSPGPTEAQPSLDDLFGAARAQSNQELAMLARKIEPGYTWPELVLPEDTTAQLHEICQRVIHRRRVLGQWGFARKLTLGQGINALFAGPSGTGKTMAAEVIARELGLDLYKIDLSGVVSKWIGETEKNLKSIFAAARRGNAILFFDEADALFGKRSEVRDAHDRYSNIEVSYLLQLMEEYDGISILATNLQQNLDDSFVRRLAFVVHFPFPDEEYRRRIWTSVWPAETPLAADLNFNALARQFKLSGGSIKNIALGASYLAAANGSIVTMSHLVHATRREYQKLGKNLSEEELKCA